MSNITMIVGTVIIALLGISFIAYVLYTISKQSKEEGAELMRKYTDKNGNVDFYSSK